MAYRLVLDENVEHEVLERLERLGHDVEHVDFVRGLGKGVDEERVAQYSREMDRVIVTHDDDFVLEVDEAAFRAVLYLGDATLSAGTVAAIVQAVSQRYPMDQLDGVEYVGPEWL